MPGGNEKVFFFKHEGDTRKITDESIDSLEDLIQVFHSKFKDKAIPKDGLEYWTTDKTYGVRHIIETPDDIYDGAVVEVVNPVAKRSGQKRKLEDDNKEHATKRHRKSVGPRFVLRLRGLPWACTEADLREFFSGIELLEAEVIFLQNGRASGEALVEVSSEEDFKKALAKNKEHIGKRYVEIFKCSGEAMDRALIRVEKLQRVAEHDRDCIIRLRGLPYSAQESDIIEFFTQAGVKPVRVHLIQDRGGGRPSGNAFVEFRSNEEKIAAMTCNRKSIGSRYIELFISNTEELSEYLGEYAPRGQNHCGDLDNCIWLKGLPFEATERDIATFFFDVGVTPTRIHRKPNGGEAYVEFVDNNDADRGMVLNKTYMGRCCVDLFRVTYNETANVVGLPLK